MAFLPALLPAWFPANGPDGTSTSALWLEVMGVVNNLVGIGLVARAVPATVGRLLAWKPATIRPAVPVPALRPAFVRPVPQLYRELRHPARRIAA